jgi:hypothetical protein
MKVPPQKFCFIKPQHIGICAMVKKNPVSPWNIMIFFGAFIMCENFGASADAQSAPGTLTSPDYTYTPDPYGGAGTLETPSGETWAQPTIDGGFQATAPDGSTVIYTPDSPQGGEIETTPAPDISGPDDQTPGDEGDSQ